MNYVIPIGNCYNYPESTRAREILRSNVSKLPALVITSIIATLLVSMTAIGIVEQDGLTSAYAQADLVATPDSSPYGASYEEWAARYWQWVLSVPSDMNPIFDRDGITCDENQPDGDVWFLLGETEGIRERTCSVPEGRAIFMPIITIECNDATFALGTDEEFAACVEDGLGDVTKVEATIDGTPISGLEDHKARTSVFEVQVPDLNIVAGEGSVNMMTDGYWIMINPLPQGEHIIELRGEVTPVSAPGDDPEPPSITSVKYIAAVGIEASPIGVGSVPPPPPEEDIDPTADNPEPVLDDEDTTGGDEQQPSGCLIATAAFGSELTPQVQYLRNFRENYILSTTSGAAFMNTFNRVYYSFSPQVADYEREQPWLQQTVKTTIYPLFGILGVSERMFWAANGGELGSMAAGATASMLIGAVYLAPLAVLAKPMHRRLKLDTRTLAIMMAVVAAAGMTLAAATRTGTSPLLELSTAMFVIILAGMTAILASRLVWSLASRLKKDGNRI
jgi:hypothetical protein